MGKYTVSNPGSATGLTFTSKAKAKLFQKQMKSRGLKADLFKF